MSASSLPDTFVLFFNQQMFVFSFKFFKLIVFLSMSDDGSEIDSL